MRAKEGDHSSPVCKSQMCLKSPFSSSSSSSPPPRCLCNGSTYDALYVVLRIYRGDYAAHSVGRCVRAAMMMSKSSKNMRQKILVCPQARFFSFSASNLSITHHTPSKPIGLNFGPKQISNQNQGNRLASSYSHKVLPLTLSLPMNTMNRRREVPG